MARHRIPVCLPKSTTTVALLLLLSVVLNASLFLSHFGILETFDNEPSMALSLSSAGAEVAKSPRLRLVDQLLPTNLLPIPAAPSQSSIEVEGEAVSLPLWMMDYLSWHREQRRTLNMQNWQEEGRKYLVVRCLRHDVPCGGLSDRLRHVPLALWIAAQTERLLLIHWEVPAPLEKFLVPPAVYNNNNSLDWRIPSWLLDHFQFSTRPTVTKVPELPAVFLNSSSNYNNTNRVLLDMRLQSYKEASDYYNNHAVSNSTDLTESPDFNAIFRPVWNLLFTPSPAVADLLAGHLQRMRLQPGQYAAAHTRTLYHFNLTGSDLQSTVENAVNCAAQLYVDSSSSSSSSNTNLNTPARILVASDSLAASQLAVVYGRGRVVSQSTRTTSENNKDNNISSTTTEYQTPLHLDREADFLQHHEQRGVLLHHQTALPASAYYNVFVDLYLLANSRCVTYDRGGFGKLGSLLSANASCFVRHKTNKCRAMLDY
jgi:hypothetical protein